MINFFRNNSKFCIITAIAILYACFPVMVGLMLIAATCYAALFGKKIYPTTPHAWLFSALFTIGINIACTILALLININPVSWLVFVGLIIATVIERYHRYH